MLSDFTPLIVMEYSNANSPVTIFWGSIRDFVIKSVQNASTCMYKVIKLTVEPHDYILLQAVIAQHLKRSALI